MLQQTLDGVVIFFRIATVFLGQKLIEHFPFPSHLVKQRTCTSWPVNSKTNFRRKNNTANGSYPWSLTTNNVVAAWPLALFLTKRFFSDGHLYTYIDIFWLDVATWLFGRASRLRTLDSVRAYFLAVFLCSNRASNLVSSTPVAAVSL